MTSQTTLSQLLTKLSDEYGVSRRPLRYFDVPKRGPLSKADKELVQKRFEELVYRELCVSDDRFDPSCYEKVDTDKDVKKKKRKSSYLTEYETFFGPRKSEPAPEDAAQIKAYMSRHKKAVKGLVRISVETGIPYEDLKDVYDIGVGAYASSGSRTGMSAEQWGYGRVYAFVVCYFLNTDGRHDKQRFLTNRTDYHIFERVVDALQ